MLTLDNVTLVSIDTKNRYETLRVMKRMNSMINFGKSLFFTNEISDDDIQIVEIDDIVGKKEGFSYSYFCLQELPRYIDTDFCLIVQHDGFIINHDRWISEFLEYDYIGAPWLDNYKNRVGNGGFSLRSKIFLETCLDIFSNVEIAEHEDLLACVHYYEEFKNRGIKFAPIDVALDFSIEHIVPEIQHLRPFGFHGSFTELGRNAIYENNKYISV